MSHFELQTDLECHLQLLALGKYSFITQIKVDKSLNYVIFQ